MDASGEVLAGTAVGLDAAPATAGSEVFSAALPSDMLLERVVVVVQT